MEAATTIHDVFLLPHYKQSAAYLMLTCRQLPPTIHLLPPSHPFNLRVTSSQMCTCGHLKLLIDRHLDCSHLITPAAGTNDVSSDHHMITWPSNKIARQYSSDSDHGNLNPSTTIAKSLLSLVDNPNTIECGNFKMCTPYGPASAAAVVATPSLAKCSTSRFANRCNISRNTSRSRIVPEHVNHEEKRSHIIVVDPAPASGHGERQAKMQMVGSSSNDEQTQHVRIELPAAVTTAAAESLHDSGEEETNHFSLVRSMGTVNTYVHDMYSDTSSRRSSRSTSSVQHIVSSREAAAPQGQQQPHTARHYVDEKTEVGAAKAWPFLARFPIGFFGICLGLGSQAVLWKTLAEASSMRFLRVPHAINIALWCTALLSLLLVSATYALKCVFYTETVKREFKHPVRVNFFFAPWIAAMFLTLGVPRAIATSLHPWLWALWMAPVFALELKIYGQWVCGREKRMLSRVANPSTHLSLVGNFVGSLLAASCGLREPAIFFWAVGFAHYLVLLVTLYQRLPSAASLPKDLHPIFFLFIAAPSSASIAWSYIVGDFDIVARIVYFLALFLYASLVLRCLVGIHLPHDGLRHSNDPLFFENHTPRHAGDGIGAFLSLLHHRSLPLRHHHSSRIRLAHSFPQRPSHRHSDGRQHHNKRKGEKVNCRKGGSATIDIGDRQRATSNHTINLIPQGRSLL